jgi:uncharacterized paraquat-inducible protein A
MQLREEFERELIALQDRLWRERGIHRYGVSFKQGLLAMAGPIIDLVMREQQGFDDLTNAEVIDELRKGPESLYWPLKSADPKAWLLCDRCRTRQLFDAEGICPLCGAEVDEA